MPLPIAAGIAAAIWAALSATIIPMAVRLLVGIGFAVVTHQFVGPMWDDVVAHVTSNLSGAPSDVKVLLQLARIDDAIAVIFSFAFALLVMKGLNAATGTVSRARWKSTVVGE